VLKGHIAVARARFPADSTGQQIDVLARGPLWAEGLDYAHGTGHGVGHIMQVHEGPASLSKRGTERLVAGMLLSNEPGYYRQGEWGIRIENLIIVNPPDDAGFLSFETITHCPIDKRLINAGMLTEAERAWLNAYHSKVEALVSPLLDGDEAVREWLRRACAPL
jgi:Xaa-Pro aminopeptidase